MFVKLFDSLFTHPFHKDVWWKISSPVVAYQPKGAVSLAASYSNLVNPGTNDAALGVAPTWNATDGWIFNGSTQYLSTGALTLTGESTAIIKFTGATLDSSIDYLFGEAVTNKLFKVGLYLSVGGEYRIYASLGTETIYTVNETTSGILALNKTGLYKDGGLLLDITDNVFTDSGGLFIGCLLGAGGSISNYSALNIQAFALYDRALSAEEILAVTRAMEVI